MIQQKGRFFYRTFWVYFGKYLLTFRGSIQEVPFSLFLAPTFKAPPPPSYTHNFLGVIMTRLGVNKWTFKLITSHYTCIDASHPYLRGAFCITYQAI